MVLFQAPRWPCRSVLYHGLGGWNDRCHRSSIEGAMVRQGGLHHGPSLLRRPRLGSICLSSNGRMQGRSPFYRGSSSTNCFECFSNSSRIHIAQLINAPVCGPACIAYRGLRLPGRSCKLGGNFTAALVCSRHSDFCDSRAIAGRPRFGAVRRIGNYRSDRGLQCSGSVGDPGR